MKFDWDEIKNKKNLLKHKISFEIAITAFDDPHALIAPDRKHSTEQEKREWLIGESDEGILVIVFTIREPNSTYRIISARKANRKERGHYGEIKGLSI
jgi:uncharacterized DUF497 family protein